MRFFVARSLLFAAMLLLSVGQASADGWRIARLPFNGTWYEGQAIYRVASILERSGVFGQGYYAIYAAEGWPGADYSFGLRYAADLNMKVRVAIFDRWPFEPDARRYDLPMGPVLRNRGDMVHYRWRFGISSRSPGDQFFILIEARTTGRHRRNGVFRHRVSLVSPAVESKKLFGRGVTYLEGPRDMMLASLDVPQSYGFEWLEPTPVGDGLPSDPDGCTRIPGDLIRNGDFCSGLLHWENSGTDAGSGIAVSDDGLRLFSRKGNIRSGLTQRIYADVGRAETLLLRADLRITREQRMVDGCRPVGPVVVSVCYEDARGDVHCADSTLWRAWTTLGQEDDDCSARRRIPKNRWFRFSENLMQLDPRPRIIRSVTVGGSGHGERDATIREVHLIERGGEIQW